MTAPRPRPDPLTRADAAFEAASRWHARLREPDADAQTHEAFQAWLAAGPNHFEAYEQADRLWRAMAGAPGGRRDDAAIEALVQSAAPRRRLARGMAVGMLLFLALAGAEWARRGGLDDLRADHVAAIGERQSVELADGSRVELNTDTALAVDFDAGQRRVRLFRGEAYFEVAHDPQRPFLVHTGEGDVRVTGTRFNVRVRDDVTEVGVVQGAVRLTASAQPDAFLALAPGEEGAITPRGLGQVRPFEAGAGTAWRLGKMVFFRASLGEVIAELNRYQRGRILILSERVRALPVTGVFDTRDPAAVIDIIEATLGISSLRLTDALIMLR
ncbi:FecR family protein [Ancylobacter dichloromethanicus]|uniref:Iron dicitrate transporter FecR n=1 Tax=Ancylobacter dichloromethanicus TaxID=518825 RepID=A0A9W6JCX5_9HYPH|nr:FecR family protein [Ancylobacter dichloromethanicus]MBS7556669.1 FecR family protein [Ancylobacter dichloromethanicus]GLK73520.1 iron dicitrate transporter FecR [Ancylobacter dichloromethanicus]